tara:strand:+ start:137 stop:709 length:573 start_codon:yes stop_codon:yes gene_type:complete
MLKPILKSYWEICLLRRSPADTLYSWLLLGIFSFLYFILVEFQWHFQKLPSEYMIKNPVISGLLMLLANYIYIGGLLKALGKANRFVQTTTSLMAVHSILHVFLLPLILIMSQLMVLPGAANQAVETGSGTLIVMILIGILSLVITIWQLVVIIYLLRKAMDTDQLSAVLAMFGLLAFTNLFASILGSLL